MLIIRRILLGLATLLCLPVFVDAAATISIGRAPILEFILHELPFRARRFDRDTWLEIGACRNPSTPECWAPVERCTRGKMVHDLTRKYLGSSSVSREYVTHLLGHREYRLRVQNQTCDGYSLGFCSGLGWDLDSLYICYDQHSILSSSGTLQH